MSNENNSDDSTNESKRNKLPQIILRGLIDEGRTVDELGQSKNLVNPPVGGQSQIKHQFKSIWHNKPEIDKYVKKKLDISEDEWNIGDSSRPSFWFTYVAQEISKLRKDGSLTDWNPELRTGIWRLTHLKGIESAEPDIQINDSDVDSSDPSRKRFFIALGPWSNWEHTLNNLPFRWGVNPSSASNVGVFKALRHGDIVYYYANKDNPRKFSKRGLFGVGKVTKIYDEEHERYWPDEKLKDEVIYKHRFEIESLKLVETDSELLPWIDGLPFTKGLNRVANEETLKQLIDNTKKMWNVDFNSKNTVPQKNILHKDPKSTLPFLTSKDIDDGYDEISKELLVSKDKILEILTALLRGRHVLLAGPIGTGKTRLAMDIPPIFWKKWGGYDAVDHTATSDWSTQDVIGGILPKVVDEQPTYQIQDGCVVSTVKKNSIINTAHSKYTDIPYAGTWLVIDEFNRAEIDKAFGQLFTALRTQNLKIPTITSDDYEDLKILKDYRIIGTLNTADKHFLFNLSDALKSRFAYIELDIPTRKQFETEIYFAMRNATEDLDLDLPFNLIVLDHTNKIILPASNDDDFYRRVMQAYYVLDTVRIFKKLGPAVLKLIYQNLIVGTIISQDSKKSLDNALTSNLIPQLEHESFQSLEIIRALNTADSLNSFITKAYDNQADKESYFNSFEKLFDYLEISNKVKFLLDFKKGNLAQDDNRWNDVKEKYSAKKENFELSLDEWPKALAELKKSNVF